MKADLVVCKFGGSSLADSQGFIRCARIIQSTVKRQAVVVSAPGKRNKNDTKITDLLLDCHALAKEGKDIGPVFRIVEDRFLQIEQNLGLELNLKWELNSIREKIVKKARFFNNSSDFTASRGEYLSGLIMSGLLHWRFDDPKDLVVFNSLSGKLNLESTYDKIRMREPFFVMPGFYGSNIFGKISVFSRGGSDISGSLVAAGLDASLYENWTDVDGILAADPKIVENPKNIREIEYSELRELAYSGASVFHDEAVSPVRRKKIPIQIKNTFNPEAPGTLIMNSRKVPENEIIIGVAAKSNNLVFDCFRDQLHSILGISADILKVFKKNEVSIEHIPTGIDTVSVVVSTQNLCNHKHEIKEELYSVLGDEGRVSVKDNLALIAVVGKGMRGRPGVLSTITGALSELGISIRMVTQGSSETNIILGVDDNRKEDAIRAIYKAFMMQEKQAAA